MEKTEQLLHKNTFDKSDIVHLLSLSEPAERALLQKAAFATATTFLGNNVYYRGIVEFSNICTLNCYYCGIRKGNNSLHRYCLSVGEVINCAKWAAECGYGSCVLQSGERRDEQFISFVEACTRGIKKATVSDTLPEGLGITLSLGEQSRETYQRFFDAGAHRYLLRIETTNPTLFTSLHPEEQVFANRLKCLTYLRKTGFQVGTGVMIGIPDQTVEDLADDILFFRDNDIDMIGMGPYLPHPDALIDNSSVMDNDALLSLALSMIAVCRLVLKDVNIAATTALQAMVHDGREQGILYGANVVMPNLTPTDFRKSYQLYDGKPCIDEGKEECRNCLKNRIESVGRTVGWDTWGDSPHFEARKNDNNSTPARE